MTTAIKQGDFTGQFTDCLFIEARHETAMTHECYLGAWRSANDIQAQAGPECIEILLERISDRIANLNHVTVPYKTRS